MYHSHADETTHLGAVVYREGDSCPICHAAVAGIDRGEPKQRQDGLMVTGFRGQPARLLPCGHVMSVVLPPGNSMPRRKA